REPRAVRAKRTEMLLGVILGAMLLGLAVLAKRWHIGPRSGQTVLSQIMGLAVGRHWAYYVVSLSITLVLALAANTSFGGLPVLASLLARDGYLPRLFAMRGDRQVFANGIWALAVLSAALLVASGGDTNSLIPLFAIGVFTGFTLAQSGLVVHWWRARPARWPWRAALNGLGAIVTATSTVVFVVTKFTEGAWVVVVAVPGFIVVFRRIHAYYRRVGEELQLGRIPKVPAGRRTRVIVPVSSLTGLSRLIEHSLGEAFSLSQDVVAVTVVQSGESGDAEEQRMRQQWAEWGPGAPLVVLRTDYASVVRPILRFIDDEHRQPDTQLVVLLPVLIPDKVRYELLHNHLDVVLSRTLSRRPDVVVARATMPLHEEPHVDRAADRDEQRPAAGPEQQRPAAGPERQPPAADPEERRAAPGGARS
ncbi:MAG TPA: amino acid permease, partial [Acidimicrobiales bacterium]|nr:amino acid permease [Acidimicrobiales bacterium]